VTSPKVSRSAATPRPPTRSRGHSLAPAHLGEGGAAAALVAAIGGLSLAIAAIAVTVQGMGAGGRYPTDPPPNLDSLGTPQVVGGAVLLLLGIGLVVSAVALLGEVRGSRLAVIGLSAVVALLSVAAFALLVGATRRDMVLLSALGVSAVIFAGTALVLARPRT
jgi:hypothetical protein